MPVTTMTILRTKALNTCLAALCLIGPTCTSSIGMAQAIRRPIVVPDSNQRATSAVLQPRTSATSILSAPIRVGEAISPDDPRLGVQDTIVIAPNGAQAKLGDIQATTSPEANRRAFDRLANVPIIDVAAREAVNQFSAPARAQPIEFNSTSLARSGALDRVMRPCDPRDPPKISRISGTITPGQEVRIYGSCFGDRPNEIRLRGNTIPNIQRLSIVAWGNNFIRATIPAMSGAWQGEAELHVIGANNLASISGIVPFTPLYETQLAISYKGCQPYNDYNNAVRCMYNGLRIESWEKTGLLQRNENKKAPFKSYGTTFSLEVHPACRLTSAAIAGYQFAPASNFRVTFNEGRPNLGYISFVVPMQSFLEEDTFGDTVRYIGYAAFRAEAECPVGIKAQ
jgi:hypothetical protein